MMPMLFSGTANARRTCSRHPAASRPGAIVMPNRRPFLAGCLLVAMVTLSPFQPTYGASLPADWATEPYNYVVVDQDLRTVIEELGRNKGIRISLSQAVQGRAKGGLPHSSARAFLDALARVYGMEWYYDGAALVVSAASESRRRVVTLPGLSFGQVLAKLRPTSFYDERFPVQQGPGDNVAVLVGPPGYVEFLASAIAGMKAPVDGNTELRVYRGGSAVQRVLLPPRVHEPP